MSKYVELEIKPEGANDSVVVIPLSATGSDGKAKTWAVRDEQGNSLVSVSSTSSTVSLGNISGTLKATGAIQFVSVADDNARDTLVSAPAIGMVVYNATAGGLQLYTGTWQDLAVVAP